MNKIAGKKYQNVKVDVISTSQVMPYVWLSECLDLTSKNIKIKKKRHFDENMLIFLFK